MVSSSHNCFVIGINFAEANQVCAFLVFFFFFLLCYFLVKAFPRFCRVLLQMFVSRAMFCMFLPNNVVNGYELPKLVSKCLFGPHSR